MQSKHNLRMILLKPTFWIGWGWKYNQSRFKLCETCSQTLISSLSELRVFTLILTLFQQVNVYIAMIRSKGPIDLFDRISNPWHWEQISYLSQLEKYSLWIENISPGISISLLADWELLRFWDKNFEASKLRSSNWDFLLTLVEIKLVLLDLLQAAKGGS